MKIGYARVLFNEKYVDSQIAELRVFGCEKIFKEKSSEFKDCKELYKMLNLLNEGDAVVVVKLERIGFSLKHLVDLMAELKEKKVDFLSLEDGIDTTTSGGDLIFNLIKSFDEFNSDLLKRSTKKGLKRAKENGRVGGKKPGLSESAKIKARYMLHRNAENNKLPKEERISIHDLIKETGVSKATFYRHLAWAKKEKKS